MRHPLRGRVWMAALIASSVLGCSPDPDLVATKLAPVPDGGDPYTNLPLVDGCKPGRYKGSVASVPDGGVAFPFAGEIQFALVESKSGEFLTLDSNATLSGLTDTGATFTTELRADPEDGGLSVGNGCHAGEVATYMTDGKYHLAQADSGSGCEPNGCFRFTGPITGLYIAPQRAFVGSWRATIDGTNIKLNGIWTAIWFATN